MAECREQEIGPQGTEAKRAEVDLVIQRIREDRKNEYEIKETTE